MLFLARANLEPQIGLQPILSPLWEQRLLPQPARLCWALSTAGLGRAKGRKTQLLHGVTRGLAEECEQFGTSWRYRGRLSPHQQGSERGRVRPAAQHPRPFPWVLMLSFFFPKCVFLLLFWCVLTHGRPGFPFTSFEGLIFTPIWGPGPDE